MSDVRNLKYNRQTNNKQQYKKMKTLKKIATLLLSLMLISGTINAGTSATVTIKGKVTDEQNNPVEFATATLISPKTKTIVKGEVCNEKGEFSITKVEPGNYILSVSMVGYEKLETENIKADSKTPVIEKNVVLHERKELLNEVVITGNKDFIEQAVDKIVINPEASPTSASENVFEILRKLPGVSVDNNDNITLKGMQGVKVLIDDKPTYLSSTQLASMLKGMQGKNVDKIEIIENPSARYDAEGNSGIINIKTKHVKAPGFNGNVNAGVNIASRFGWNGSLDLNMKYNKINLYGNYSNYNWAGTNSMNASRMFTSTALQGAYQLIDTEGEYKGSSHNYKAGIDYYLTKNHVISGMVRGNFGGNNNIDKSTTSFTDKFKNVDSMLVTLSENKNRWKNNTYNLNYKWDIDSTGQTLLFDIDYALFGFNGNNNQSGEYKDPNGNMLNNSINVETEQGSAIKILTSKLDYVLPISKKSTVEAGLKTSNVTTDSHINMTGFLTQNDHFIYTEAIQAAYLNGKTQLNNTTLQLGLRLENTISKGNSVSTNTVKDTSYLKLFPSLFIMQKLNNKNNVNFKYSYRIGRPGYHHLNPFRWMIDPYTYNVGNPNLSPQFTHSIGLGHNYNSMFITNLGVNYTTGLFTEVIKQDDASKTVYQTNENLNNALDINLSETFQLKPLNWWRLNGTITGMYKTIQLNENSTSTLSMPSVMANLSNNFTLPYKINLEANARFSSSQLISNIIVRPRFTLDLGIQKSILKDKGMIKVSLSDVFRTANGGAYAKFDNVDIDVMNKWDSRKLNITFNYHFGKDNFKTRANRATSSSEEESRSSKN